MFLFIALNQVVLCYLFPVQQTTSRIGHRVKYFFSGWQPHVRNNNHKKCYVSFHGAQGVLLYQRKQLNSTLSTVHLDQENSFLDLL